MYRKRNRLENQCLEKSSQKGASVIILALIIMVFMSVTIIGITKLTISEKKRAKSTSVSAEAYQKADEAMECALWGRNAIIEACSDKTVSDASDDLYNLYFPQDIKGEDVYCHKYANEITPYHLGLNDVLIQLPIDDTGNYTCTSPFYISLFTSKGKVASTNPITGEITKQRGIGATVHTSDAGSESSLFKPYVCCNKIAKKGEIYNLTIENKCGPSSVLKDDEGPNGNRGWLEYWEPCKIICNDPCAYYDTSIDPADDADSLYNTGDEGREGAHWCFTNDSGFGDSTIAGSLYNCMVNHTGATPNDEAKYWNHPDVEGFCSVCNRVEATGSTGENTGNICGEMATNVADVNDSVWGASGKPDDPICQGALGENNCYSCNCINFRNHSDHSDFCDTCPKTGVIYNCGAP